MEKIKLHCTFKGDKLPEYGKVGDSAMDVYAWKLREVKEGKLLEVMDFPSEGYTLNPLDRVLIPSGLTVDFIDDVDCTCRPRSGMTLKHGIVTQIGTLDNNYRGDIGLIVINMSNEPYVINKGDRLGQLRFSRPIIVELDVVDEINTKTDRGDTGFGHSGK